MIVKTYNIVKEFNCTLLDTEISTSNTVADYSGFTTGDDFIEVYGTSLIDEVGLDAIINNHVATPSPVYKLTESLDDPRNLDYDIYGLHKKKTIVAGELVLVEYYKNYNGTDYSDLVVSETRNYVRNAYGLVTYRTQVSYWYLTNDTIGCTKTTTKYYNVQESMEEAETRRRNLLSDAKLYTASQVGLTNALDLMTSVNAEISLYIQGEQTALITAINNSTKEYLTQEIKDTLVYLLTLND